MILVVTPHLQSDQSSEVLRRATNEDVIMVDDLRKAAALLRSESYLAVVIDQYLMETEPEASDSLMQHLGTAIPIQANLAISGAERLGRGAGYEYSHDHPDGWADQAYLPEERRYYEPVERGFEAEIRRRLEALRERRKGEPP